MITVSVLYPNEAGSRFDMDYYLGSLERGLGGPAPGSPAPYSTVCHLRFASLEEFHTAFGPHATTIQNDIANYSSVAPVIQISDVKLD